MTDTRRKAAEEASFQGRAAAVDWVMRLKDGQEMTIITLTKAHLAGQECGEQRAVEGIVRCLKRWGYDVAANDIERGVWKEKP